MVKTNRKKQESRDDRMKSLPRRERFAKAATIKKSEGRVLNSSEKRAIKMKGTQGSLLRAWEVLRASADKVDEKLSLMRQQAAAIDAADVPVTQEDFDAATGQREGAVNKVLEMVGSDFAHTCRTPTGSRVIQSCVKFGTHEQRNRLLDLLIPDLMNHCSDGFGHFVIEGMVRHCNQGAFKRLLGALLPHVAKLAPHKCGIKAIHAVYSSNHCNANERHLLVLAIFKDSVAVMKSWPGYPVLEDMLEAPSEHRKRLLKVLFELTDKLVGLKDSAELPFVQRLLNVLFLRGRKDELGELAVTLKPHLVTLASASKEGAELASRAFAVMPPKVRRETLKVVLSDFQTLATGKCSAPFVARLFDLTYDPQLACKCLGEPLAAAVATVAASPYGSRILLHLFTPDGDRKQNLLLPNWWNHNLYSRSNAAWCQFAWLDEDFKEEVVEICPKPAEASHRAVLPAVAAAFVKNCCAEGTELPRAAAALVGRIAVEMLHLHAADPEYRDAMALGEEAVAALTRVQSKKAARVEVVEPEDKPVAKKTKADPASSPKAASPKVTAASPKATAASPKATAASPKGKVASAKAAEPTPSRKSVKIADTPAPLVAPASTPVTAKRSPAQSAASPAASRAPAVAAAISAAADPDAPEETSARLSAVAPAPAAAGRASRKSVRKSVRKSFADDDGSGDDVDVRESMFYSPESRPRQSRLSMAASDDESVASPSGRVTATKKKAAAAGRPSGRPSARKSK